ncbi:hypothetical protein [Streptomyces sp. NPDC101776]|uniref:hypothetical protein n=1 Tax=Streptomyces sp. NPDC101776 TaxID=3366146 RepID=UPI00381F95D0
MSRPAAALPPLAALQQAAGNAAVSRAIQRARDERQAEEPRILQRAERAYSATGRDG